MYGYIICQQRVPFLSLMIHLLAKYETLLVVLKYQLNIVSLIFYRCFTIHVLLWCKILRCRSLQAVRRNYKV